MAKKRRRKMYEPLAPPVRPGTLRNSITYQAPLTVEFDATWGGTGDYRRLMEMLEPHMTEAEWLVSENPARMLRHLQTGDGRFALVDEPGLDRKLRLFACFCARMPVWGGPGHSHNIHIDEVERWADGGPAPACKNIGDHAGMNVLVADSLPAALWWAGDETYMFAALSYKADLLRCLFGNPFRDVVVTEKESGPPSVREFNRPPDVPWIVFRRPWLTWNSGVVPSMAQTIYAERRFENMPVLSDALEEAGCADEAILAHGRCSGPHARGCWVLDLILGKS